MKFRGTLKNGAMPIPEGSQYQVFRESAIIPDSKYNNETAIKIIAKQLRVLADNIEKYETNGFVVSNKKDEFELKKSKDLELINIHLTGSITEPPAAFFLDSEDTGWRIDTMLKLMFE